MSRLYSWYFRHDIQNRRFGWRLFSWMKRLKPVAPFPSGSEHQIWIELDSVNDNDVRSIAHPQPYEPQIQAVFREFVKPDHVVVDVGANVGRHIVLLDQLAGEVIAVEPHPKLLPALRRTVAELSRTTLHERALSAYDGSTNFSIDGDHTAGAIAEKGVVVPVCRLDLLLKGRRVHLIKIDVEGHETAVLQGATTTISRWHPIVVYEQLSKFGTSAHEFLQAYGSTFTVIKRNGTREEWNLDL